MLKAIYQRGPVTFMDKFGSTLFEKEKHVDVILSSKVLLPNSMPDKPCHKRKGLNTYGKTLVIDLQRQEEEIFADIHKHAKYQINRARKRDDFNFQVQAFPSDEQLQHFFTFFNQFAKHKNLPLANFEKLKGLRDKQGVVLTYMTDENQNVLCYHAYVSFNHYCYLLYSASARFDNAETRNKIGRANRYLHWRDIQYFRDNGYEWYDLGGIFVYPSEPSEVGVTQFKKEFGGVEVDIDKWIYANSLLGKLVVFIFWLKMRKSSEFLYAKTLNKSLTI